MTALAPTLQAFFTDRLMTQRRASPATINSYRDTWRLLLGYIHNQTRRLPSQLDITDLDPATIGAFLNHLENERGNSVRTRNVRLAAIHSLFKYAALLHPEHAALIARVLAIPTKKHDRANIAFLNTSEVDALLSAPDPNTGIGRRDHALLLLAIQTGLRVSELVGLTISDVHPGPPGHVRCHGKGRKDRVTPLTTQTTATLVPWLAERGGQSSDPLFPTRRNAVLSTDAVEWLLAKHVNTAAQRCPSLRDKRVTPHVLRHTCAMNLLHSGVDISVIALWLGHESVSSTQAYIHADLQLKERALARTTPPNTAPGRYHPPDPLLAFLESL